MAQIMYGFTKVRFTSTVYRPKDNFGTSSAVFYDNTGTAVYSINSDVCPTSGSKEHIIQFPFYTVSSVKLTRFIDTRSDGNATMKIELFDSYSNKWIQVLYTTSYRTSDSWRTNSYDLNGSSASILEVMKETMPLTLNKDNVDVSTINLTKVKLTNPSMIFKVGPNFYYGALFDYKSGYTTFRVGNKYLTSIMVKLGSGSITLDHGGGTHPTYSGWDLRQLFKGQGFIHGINFSVNIIVTSGNYDRIAFEAYIMNKYDNDKNIYLSQWFGIGDNWYVPQNFSYTLTEEDKQKLGGPNTELVLKTRMINDCGSSYVNTRYTFTLTTT